MTDPRRILDDVLGDGAGSAGGAGLERIERDLLRSARGDAPSADARNRAAIALGIAGGAAFGTAVGSAAASTAASGAASGASGAAGAGKVAAIGGGAALFKWIGIGIAGALLTVTAAKVIAPRDVQSRDALHVESRDVQGSRGVAPSLDPFAVIPPPPPAIVDPPLDNAITARGSSASAASSSNAMNAPPHNVLAASPSSSVTHVASITDEIALLDQARTALAQGDTGTAMRVLADHDRAFPNGSLGPEAAVLRIDALAAGGDDSRARAEADRFLAAHPNGPQSRHVHSVIDHLTKATNP